MGNGEYQAISRTKINAKIRTFNQKRMIKSSLWNRIKSGLQRGGKRAARYKNSRDDGIDTNLMQRIAEKLDATVSREPCMRMQQEEGFLRRSKNEPLREPYPVDLTPAEELEDIEELRQAARYKLNKDLFETYKTYRILAEIGRYATKGACKSEKPVESKRHKRYNKRIKAW